MKRAIIQAFIIGFLGFQLALPVRGLVFDKRHSRGNFTWNMYSQSRTCSVDYRLVQRDGTMRELNYRDFFVRKSRASHVLFPDTLPHFHEWLCRTTQGQRAAIHARVSCSLNGSPRFELTDPAQDICTEPDWGVLDP